jgi:hypothetical protein
MTMRWKRRSILALAALIIFCSVPVPNVRLPSFVVRHLVTRSDFQASIQATCRVQARDAKRSIRDYRCGRIGSTAMGAYKAALL